MKSSARKRGHSALIVQQMMKRVRKDFEVKQLRSESNNGTKKRRRKKIEGVRKGALVEAASWAEETEQAKSRRVKDSIKMLTSKAMKGSSSKVAAILSRR